jgi:integrase
MSQVQDVLGHADPSTTKSIYAHYTPKKLRAVVLEYSGSPAELLTAFEAKEAAR